MTKPVLPFVEIMATQACNISCTGCTNYSDLNHKGWLSWEQARAQITPWLQRVDIPDFGILGGEPLLNPEIRDWIRGIRELMPKAQIRFTTNGLLLDKNLDIVDLAAEVGNIVFKIGVHTDSLAIEQTIDYILNRFDWQPVTEFGINRLLTKNKFRFQINRPTTFWKSFRGDYTNMQPHNSNPAEAFSICCQKTCPLLYQGKIYKCSTSGLLLDVLEKFGHQDNTEWLPFISQGLQPDCTDQQLQEFLNNFGRPHKICGQCPTQKDLGSKIVHLQNVHTKKIKS